MQKIYRILWHHIICLWHLAQLYSGVMCDDFTKRRITGAEKVSRMLLCHFSVKVIGAILTKEC